MNIMWSPLRYPIDTSDMSDTRPSTEGEEWRKSGSTGVCVREPCCRPLLFGPLLVMWVLSLLSSFLNPVHWAAHTSCLAVQPVGPFVYLLLYWKAPMVRTVLLEKSYKLWGKLDWKRPKDIKPLVFVSIGMTHWLSGISMSLLRSKLTKFPESKVGRQFLTLDKL